MFLSADRNYMELAILEMAKCNESPGRIRVGCIVVLKGEIIASGYKLSQDLSRTYPSITSMALRSGKIYLKMENASETCGFKYEASND